MSETQILRSREETTPYLPDIVQAADANPKALGFLAHGVYRDAIERERIWVAVADGRFCGHLFFGGVTPVLKVKQLYVDLSYRRRGIARSFVEQLVIFAQENGYGSIRARVAEDLDANDAWERLGFTIGRVVQGGRTTGRQLLVRFRRVMPAGSQLNFLALCDRSNRDLGQIKALGLPVNRSECYTLDLNVWMDFLLDRHPFDSAARALIVQASRGLFRLRITDEFQREARRTAVDRDTDPLLRVALEWPTLPPQDASSIEQFIGELRPLVFPDRSIESRRAAQDQSDLRHLAISIRGGATGFVTRDRALLRAGDRIRETYGFQIVAPSDLIEEEPADVFVSPPLGMGEGDGALLLEEISRQHLSARAFVERGAAVRPGWHRRVDAESEGRVCLIDGRVIGVVHWVITTGKAPEVELIVAGAGELDEDGRRQAFDVLVGWLLLRVRPSVGMTRVLLRVDLETTQEFSRDLERAGFFPTERPGDFVRFVLGSPLSVEAWSDVSAVVERELGARSTWLGNAAEGPVLRFVTAEGQLELDRFAFETRFGLTAQTLAERSGWYVPITEPLRDELLPLPRQPALFRRRDASWRMERVYFRSPQKPWPEAGDIILFYVSGSLGVVGFARCTASLATDVGEARERFGRQAVIEPEKAARDGRVHCIAFDNYAPLPRPIDVNRLRAMNAWPSQGPVSTVPLPAKASLVQVLSAGLA